MGMFSEKKKLVVVYEEKDELAFNLLKKLIETDDDDKENNVIVGSEDGTITVIGWTEKVYLDNKKKGNISNKIIFLDDVKGVGNIAPIMDKKFDKFGISYGFAGNQAVISINERQIGDAQTYEQMTTYFTNYFKIGKNENPESSNNAQQIESSIEQSELANTQLKNEHNPGNAKKRRIMAIAVSVIQPFYGIPFVVNSVLTHKKLRNEMFINAINKFYLDELDAFMKK